MLFKRLILIAFFLISNNASAAGELGYVIAVIDANVYQEPSLSSPVIGHALVTSPVIGRSKISGWFLYDFGLFEKVNGWVRREDVATEIDLKQVVGCWPFSRVDSAEGESTFDYISFDSSGKAKIFTWNKIWPAQIYIYKNLVLIKPVSKSKHAPFGDLFGFDAVNKKLLPGGYASLDQKITDKPCPIKIK